LGYDQLLKLGQNLGDVWHHYWRRRKSTARNSF
jgi:hypothetical protein